MVNVVQIYYKFTELNKEIKNKGIFETLFTQENFINFIVNLIFSNEKIYEIIFDYQRKIDIEKEKKIVNNYKKVSARKLDFEYFDVPKNLRLKGF